MPMPFGSLWLPVVVSTIAVFVVSCVIHVVMTHHKGDFGKLPDEDALADEVRRQAPAPGQYMFPHCGGKEGMKDPAFKAKWERGPALFLVVRGAGMPGMGPAMGLWALNVFAVSFLTAYVARHALQPGAACVEVARITGTVGIAAYTMATWTESIWKWRPWRVTVLAVVDGVVYAVAAALVFCWLWPAAH